MKLIPVVYYGFATMDVRFSNPMLPWIVSEIRKREHCEKLSLGVEYGNMQAYNQDFELQFSHRIHQIMRFSQADLDPCAFLYLLKDDNEKSLFCYMYQAQSIGDVVELYKQMKDQSGAQPSKTASTTNLTSLCVDISPSLSNFFEVLYIGKLKVFSKRIAETFIDDALERFRLHEMEKGRRGSVDSITRERVIAPNLQRSESSAAKLCEAAATPDDHNRTMVLQVDRTDLRLISPDRKIILLQKHHKEVVACLRGADHPEHFGFVSRDPNDQQSYVGYIFKCNSSSICVDAVSAINQAFASTENRPKAVITSCDHCPMIWFHKLCAEIENMTDRKTRAAILRKIETLDEDEQKVVMAKFNGVETDSMVEQNEFLMMLLRAHCEMKQARHVHDTAENRSEFLNQYLGGGTTIFNKAKRSLSNSFEMLKRRASRDDFGAVLKELNLPLNNSKESPITPEEEESKEEGRKNSLTPDKTQSKSPMIDIFFKVGSPKDSPKDPSSWRQAIFKKVITPNKQITERPKKSREELRELWKKAINQAILLVRMEKENTRLRAKQEESAVKRIKLEYDEMKPNQRAVIQVWELITNKNSSMKCDRAILLQAIKEGVPRDKRGEVWMYLAKQFCLTIPPIDEEKYPNYHKPYEVLLKDLTSHQHAILIDLGRTFPNHSYFSSPLGPGQLALFNLLKAYSLLDPEVGYCQGYSFIVGVLLLHMEESQAFFLFRHLMFRRGLRKQYLPDMTGLQVRLYQLSRLVYDKLPDLSEHFDKYDVSPTLYAAPWLLTIFSSQFPLGFVTRVFDLVFLEGLDVVFIVSVSILAYHKEQLLGCDSFEDIMTYLKEVATKVDRPALEKIMKQVYTMDIKKKLLEYKVEYQVLQEERLAVQPQVENVHRLETENKKLKEENKKMATQLEIAQSNVQRMEKQRTLLQSQMNRKEMQNRGLEVTVATLGQFINELIDEKDLEVPDDVRRIVTQIAFVERRNREGKPQNVMKMFQGNMVKSLSTGVIQDEAKPFFSNIHNQLLKEKSAKVEVTIEEINENLANNNETVGRDAPEPVNDNHPLSNCDVNFSFGGTRELRHLGTNLRSRNASLVRN